jgi:hypothetical protein
MNGTISNGPPEEDPAPTIATLNQTHGVPTYVVTADPDEPAKVATSNEFAVAGGTGAAHLAYMGDQLTGELTDAIEAALGNTYCE